jgi:hypothetical protein
MTVRENLITVLEGGTPEKTPLSIYNWNMNAVTAEELADRLEDPEWRRLLDMGLALTHHCEILEAVEHGVETKVERDGDSVVETKITPLGSVRQVHRGDWQEEFWIKTPDDYRIYTWIVKHTEIVPRYERYEAGERVVGDQGVVVLTGTGNWLHRTPAMKINVDLAGTQQFCMDIALEVPELFDLYEALLEQFLEEQRLLAAGPGRYVKWLENLTISMLGPDRYRDLLMSVYKEAVPVLEAGGKRVMVHYDGALSVIKDQIAEAPFHMFDSLTEPPEGDMLYDECRTLWPGKVFWANINVDLYRQPADVLRQAVIDKRGRAGKRALAFEISEDRPHDWQKTIPVVLETLNELP